MNSVFKTLLFQPESIPSCKNAFVRAMLYCVSYLSGTFTTVLRENPFLRTSCSKLFNATFLKICLKIMTSNEKKCLTRNPELFAIVGISHVKVMKFHNRYSASDSPKTGLTLKFCFFCSKS